MFAVAMCHCTCRGIAPIEYSFFFTPHSFSNGWRIDLHGQPIQLLLPISRRSSRSLVRREQPNQEVLKNIKNIACFDNQSGNQSCTEHSSSRQPFTQHRSQAKQATAAQQTHRKESRASKCAHCSSSLAGCLPDSAPVTPSPRPTCFYRGPWQPLRHGGLNGHASPPPPLRGGG